MIGPTESPSNQNGQYTGDFCGMHLAVEDYDARFLETHQISGRKPVQLKDGIFDGNRIKRNQGRYAVTDDRDFQNIRQQLRPARSADWLRSHVNWDLWYRYHTVCEGPPALRLLAARLAFQEPGLVFRASKRHRLGAWPCCLGMRMRLGDRTGARASTTRKMPSLPGMPLLSSGRNIAISSESFAT
ncbi:MAG: hypothetical protein CM1200mP29_03170 [Verrucomicrobiota bacterium]|nr:MAG: hypothetical protein CM1200mP29_03170 [Verrucomicrobiota bacterium]